MLYLPLSKGGLKFPCFGTMVKALRLSWISRFLLGSDESWKAIPNSYFTKLGGLPFILKCNYNAKKLGEKLPTFCRELLDYFADLRNNFEDMHQKTFILWNNKNITIEGKSFYWKAWFDKDISSLCPRSSKQERQLPLAIGTQRQIQTENQFFEIPANHLRNTSIYYMEESVLLGTKPLVDSISHSIRDPSGVFSVCHAFECHIVQ